jgi:hypothetical protein
MKILFYSSPYQYYLENLTPLVEAAKERGHKVYTRFALKEEKNIRKLLPDGEETHTIHDLIEKRMVDAVVLVQPWWYADKEVAGACNKYNVPFYIVDHAPPMMPYTEASGKKSHLYRARLYNARAFFAYGAATKQVMRKRGCKEKIVVTGSPRVEAMLERYKGFEQKKDFKAFVLYDTSHRMEDKSLIKEVNKLRKDLGADWQIFIKRHARSPDNFRKISGIGSLEGPEEQIVFFADMVGFTFPSSAMILPAIVDKDMVALYDKHYCTEAVGYFRKYQEAIPNRKGKRVSTYKEFITDNYHTRGSPTKTILDYIEGKT